MRGVDYVKLSPEVSILHTATLAFDASTFEIWGPLLNGGCCVLHSEAVPTPKGLAETIRGHGVTTAFLTTALFNAVVNEDPAYLHGLRQILVGGEALSVSHVCRAQQALPETEIINAYGPTECTTFTTTYRIPRPFDSLSRSVPIGRPILDTRAYVLDAEQQLAPTGVIGELYVGGAGVARGYLGRPELTLERFVRLTHVADGDRLYRTGDLVRYLRDGAIEFVGRRDAQVKVRGFRIELGEIEARLVEHPAVKQATVITREDRPGDVRLDCVCHPGARWRLHQHRAPGLPPGDSAGLHDSLLLRRARRPAPDGGWEGGPQGPPELLAHAARKTTSSCPRATTGSVLVAELWARSLRVPRVSAHDNFFDLGGHSLLCLEVIAELERRSGVRLNPRDMLFGTLEAVASRLPGGTAGR